jgi:hypothetical protein
MSQSMTAFLGDGVLANLARPHWPGVLILSLACALLVAAWKSRT